jgi:ribosomal protein L7/L12
MEFKGEDSLFQNCGSCGAPIVVPSSISEPDRDKGIESTVGMPPEKVMKAESFSQVQDHLDKEEARVEEIKESGGVIDPILADSKNVIENIVSGQQSFVEDFPADTLEVEETSREPNPQIMERIFNEVQAGRKIEAIKLYREAYNTSLAEAKEMVEKAFANVPVIGTEQNEPAKVEITMDSANQKLGVILQQLQSGNKIFAIKLFREQFGTGLKEAKDAVDAMERGEKINISDYI